MITRVFSRLSPRRWKRLNGARIIVATELWDAMIGELGVRGLNGTRESGAFLLTRRAGNGKTVDRVVYLDDLDSACLVGGIHFHASGYSKLWSLCDQEDLRVIADVHTHPGPWVGQSGIDRDNPMVARTGHLALILPDLATRKIAAAEVGIHEYRGAEGWYSCGREAARLLYIGRV